MHAQWFTSRRRASPTVCCRSRTSHYKVAWHHAVRMQLTATKTTGTFEAATPLHGRKPVGSKLVFACKTDKDGLIVITKARPVAKGLGQVQDIHYFQTFAPTLSSARYNYGGRCR